MTTFLTLRPDHPIAKSTAFLDWLGDEGIEANVTYKVAIRGRRVKVWQFDRNEDGRKYVDPVKDRVAVRDPFVVRVSRVPDFGCRSGKRRYALHDIPEQRTGYPCAFCRSWHVGLPMWLARLTQKRGRAVNSKHAPRP